MKKRQLEKQLAGVESFSHARVDLEQYLTPPSIAAELVHIAHLRSDLERPVVDLGTGTGIFAIAASVVGVSEITAVDIDREALAIAQTNEVNVTGTRRIRWMLADVFHLPICDLEPATVIMNPPFGAQRDNRHADRAFLAVASDIATVSYSMHNAGSEAFVRAFAADNGGVVTDGFSLEMPLPKLHTFHRADIKDIAAECFRIEWTNDASQ